MIATVSPAGSNVDESLSTLRYAQQARTIINLAKVNEDTNAKLIRGQRSQEYRLKLEQPSSLRTFHVLLYLLIKLPYFFHFY